MTRVLLIISLLATVAACDTDTLAEPTEVGATVLEASTSDCIDEYFDCGQSCDRFDFGCRSDCTAELRVCLDGGAGGGSSSSACSASAFRDGVSLGANCRDGACTCTVNGSQVGSCSGDSCDLDSGCCAEFFR